MKTSLPQNTDRLLPLSSYDRGFAVHSASMADPRFSYSLYVPDSALEADSKPTLIVSVHGTGRDFVPTLHALAPFARRHNCVVLCPLFPAGVRGDRNLHGYKYLLEGDIRYDRVLLDMIDEVAGRYGANFSRFALCGFSGGGHFVHRFLLLHPQLLLACSIGAPGSVTLIDDRRQWWVGTGDIESTFAVKLDLDALRRVPVHMAVGSEDTDTAEITHQPGGRYWMAGANDAGKTRPERLAALKNSFQAQGIDCSLTVMAGAGHDGARYDAEAEAFFSRVLFS